MFPFGPNDAVQRKSSQIEFSCLSPLVVSCLGKHAHLQLTLDASAHCCCTAQSSLTNAQHLYDVVPPPEKVRQIPVSLRAAFALYHRSEVSFPLQ